MALALSLGSTFAGDGKSVKEVKEVVEPTCKFRDFEASDRRLLFWILRFQR